MPRRLGRTGGGGVVRRAALLGCGALLAAGCTTDDAAVPTTPPTVTVPPTTTSEAPPATRPTTVPPTSSTTVFPPVEGCPGPAVTAPSDGPIALAAMGPLTGPALESAAVVRGLQAHLAVVNTTGGVGGRTITLEVVDDRGDPAVAVAEAVRLEQAGVQALVGSVGLAANTAVRAVANERCLPQLFVASGDPSFSDASAAPWTLGGPVSFPGEGAALGRAVLERYPAGARVAVLRLDNATGAAYRAALDTVLAGSPVTVVAEQVVPLDATSTAPQVQALAAAQADVFVNLTASLFCPRALADLQGSGWRPGLVLQTSLCSSAELLRPVGAAADGVVVARLFKDPADPRWADDAAVRRHVQTLAAVAPGTPPSALTVIGWTTGELLTAALNVATARPDGVTRASLAQAAWGAGRVQPSLALPGVALRLTPGVGLGATAVELSTWRASSGTFEPLAPVVPT